MAAPAAALALVAGTALNVFGQFQAASIAKDQAGVEQNILGNRLIAIEQEKVAETEDEELRRRLIAGETREEIGAFQVAAAARGVVVNQGSAGEGRANIAAEGKYKQLLSAAESSRRKRNLTIQAVNTQTSLSQSRLRSREEQKAAKIRIASTVLTAGSTGASTFTTGKGTTGKSELQFRTT